jgi:hypothetical protein
MRHARKRGLAGLAVLGITVVAGLLAAWGVSPGESSQIAPADVVALRFPADWMNSDETTGTAETVAPAAAPATFALASAGDTRLDTGLMFSPRQTYATPMQPVAAPAPQPAALAVAAPAVKPEPRVEARAEIKPETKPAAPTRSIAAAPQHKPAARKKDSGELFNDAQLASIKTRLKLSQYQEQYWPPVENALRAIGRTVARGTPPKTTAMGYASESRLAAQIDPDSDEVQQLKSAAFPLIMSMNDDQKQQVRNIAHVMGLERVASSF